MIRKTYIAEYSDIKFLLFKKYDSNIIISILHSISTNNIGLFILIIVKSSNFKELNGQTLLSWYEMNQNGPDFISMHVGCKAFFTKLQQELEIVMKNKKWMKADLLKYVNTLWSKCGINLSKNLRAYREWIHQKIEPSPPTGDRFNKCYMLHINLTR